MNGIGLLPIAAGMCTAIAMVAGPAQAAPPYAGSAPAARADGCPCDGDVDGNGMINVADVAIVVQQVQAACDPALGDPLCVASDINCDGSVDLLDLAAIQCLFEAGAPDPTCCGLEPPCPCVSDLDGDGLVNLIDFAMFAQCFGGPPSGACADADIDCDGDVDYADFVVLCHQYGTVAPFDTSLCDRAVGACCWAFDTYPGGSTVVCRELSRLDCAVFKGHFVGTDTPCAEVDCTAMPVCRGDLDGNNTCDVFDFGVFTAYFDEPGLPGRCDGDFDGDGHVTVFDFGIFTGLFDCFGPPLPAQCCGQIQPPPLP